MMASLFASRVMGGKPSISGGVAVYGMASQSTEKGGYTMAQPQSLEENANVTTEAGARHAVPGMEYGGRTRFRITALNASAFYTVSLAPPESNNPTARNLTLSRSAKKRGEVFKLSCKKGLKPSALKATKNK